MKTYSKKLLKPSGYVKIGFILSLEHFIFIMNHWCMWFHRCMWFQDWFNSKTGLLSLLFNFALTVIFRFYFDWIKKVVLWPKANQCTLIRDSSKPHGSSYLQPMPTAFASCWNQINVNVVAVMTSSYWLMVASKSFEIQKKLMTLRTGRLRLIWSESVLW